MRVCDLDFSRRQIHIRQSCWHGKIQTLKTKGNKKPIPMTSHVEAALRGYLVGHKHELLFVNGRGHPYSRNKIVQTILHPALDALGIRRKGRRIGLHAFRHTLSSILLDVAQHVRTAEPYFHSSALSGLRRSLPICAYYTGMHDYEDQSVRLLRGSSDCLVVCVAENPAEWQMTDLNRHSSALRIRASSSITNTVA